MCFAAYWGNSFFRLLVDIQSGLCGDICNITEMDRTIVTFKPDIICNGFQPPFFKSIDYPRLELNIVILKDSWIKR